MSRFKQLLIATSLLYSFSLIILTQATSESEFLDALEKLVNETNANVDRPLKCQRFEFKCRDNSRCIRKENFCNRHNDCTDGSDEYFNCTTEKICQSYEFNCGNGYCVPNSKICDGYDDCLDNSDEESCEAHHCMKNVHLCDQLCIVKGESYECQCQDGYELQPDKKSCKALKNYGESLMLYATNTAIKLVNLLSMNTTQLVSDLNEVIGIEMDASHVYWSDWNAEHTDNSIFRSLIYENRIEPFITNGVGFVEEIAVDWVTNNIYYIDSLKKIFGVCSSNGKYCTSILHGDHLNPSSLVLNPVNSEMFWSEWSGAIIGYIGKSKMNGDNRSVFVKYNIVHPTGITIDHPKQRLYWVDVMLQQIESVNLDGTARHKIMSTDGMTLHSIAILEDRLYWSDYRASTINSCNKFTAEDRKILINETEKITSMQIHHPLLKANIQNPCKFSNCSEICLLAGNTDYTCACTLDKELSEDGHTCKARSDKQYLIAVTNSFYYNYYGEFIGHPNLFTFNESFPHFTAIAYDSLNYRIYLNDKESSRIFYYDLQRNKLKNIKSIKNQYVNGMSFDYIGKNLYWCNGIMKSIEVYNIENEHHKSWRYNDTPVNIIVVPEYGTMIVAFCSSDECRLDKLTMTGRHTGITLVQDKILGPTVSLAYDPLAGEIIWADKGTGNMESISLDGKYRRRIHTGLLGPVSIAVLNDRVYWTLYSEMTIFKSKTIPTRRGFVPVYYTKVSNKSTTDILQLISTNDHKNKIDHECNSLSNGGCSHLCLIGFTTDYECACPNGLILGANNHDCEIPAACEGNVHRCLDNSCIDVSKVCDGIIDCLDQDDEANCGKKNSTCLKDEFQCKNGKCISKDHVCNGEEDCEDLTDELNCPFRKCSESTYFECKLPNEFCIPQSWQCDGVNDCDDGSDEVNCDVEKCPVEMILCENHVCIESGLSCNSIDDCGDKSDESVCYEHTNLIKPTQHCNIDEYRCIGTEKCISKNLRCNMNRDCPNGDDEHNCNQCDVLQFTCNNLQCIQKNKVCDTKNDCGDNSDEEFCDNHKRMQESTNLLSRTPVAKLEKDTTKYICGNGQSLYYSQVCDGEYNCKDHSDEDGACDIMCINSRCNHHCEQTPRGPQCICMPGYKLLADNSTCENINECTLDGMCSQICHDTEGKYRCDCVAGFSLKSDGRTCKVNDNTTIIFTATKHDIRQINRNFQMIDVIGRTHASISGMDINIKEKLLFWSDEKSGTITEFKWDDKTRRIINYRRKPNLIAVDWITNNIYFVNNEKPYSIVACTRYENKCSIIVKLKKQGNVTSLTVDPINGFVFWAQAILSPNKNPSGIIYRCDMNGENLMIIANNKVGMISGIAVHHERSQLFWIDRSQEQIVKSNLNGTDRSVFRRVHQPLTINIYEDSIYWIMGSTRTLFSCPLYDAIPCQPIPFQPSNVEDFLVISHITRQPYAMNYCAKAKCDWMCTNKNESGKCICLDGKTLNSNSPNCQSHGIDVTDPDVQTNNTNITGNDKHPDINQARLILIILIGVSIIIMIGLMCFIYREYLPDIARNIRDAIINLRVPFRNTSSDARRNSPPSSDEEHRIFPSERIDTNPPTYAELVELDQMPERRALNTET